MHKAIQFDQAGGPEVMVCREVPVEAPSHGTAQVRIDFAGVNFIDTYHRSGLYPAPTPFTLGVEGAGVIEQLGPDTPPGLEVGDRVGWTMIPGSYAELCNIPATQLIPIPETLSTELAAASLLQGMTAHYLTHGVRDAKPGETALVHAAAGGTGGLLVQLLKQAGLMVIGTCGTQEKAELARASGADEVILYSEEDFQARTLQITEGAGVDVVYDSVGQSTFEKSLTSLRPRGLLCLFGQASGPVPPFDLGRLGGLGSLFVTRPTLGHFIQDPEELALRAGAVFDGLARGALKQRVHARYALEDAAQAHRDLEGRGTKGKLLLECR
ncbi:MAG: quinone oxidoreductase [Myxococcota bacterium]